MLPRDVNQTSAGHGGHIPQAEVNFPLPPAVQNRAQGLAVFLLLHGNDGHPVPTVQIMYPAAGEVQKGNGAVAGQAGADKGHALREGGAQNPKPRNVQLPGVDHTLTLGGKGLEAVGKHAQGVHALAARRHMLPHPLHELQKIRLILTAGGVQRGQLRADMGQVSGHGGGCGGAAARLALPVGGKPLLLCAPAALSGLLTEGKHLRPGDRIFLFQASHSP
ncbi:hypothetical protein SDC9_127863 [bioreactor metagenome]|uniref:Uncharacterized protein n=1 Tax=bioreactor metagenome TaxID=1076179 RepID=A0A645CV98_9ZZZZ